MDNVGKFIVYDFLSYIQAVLIIIHVKMAHDYALLNPSLLNFSPVIS